MGPRIEGAPPKPGNRRLSRRAFLGVGVAAPAATLAQTRRANATPAPRTAVVPLPARSGGENALLRMQRELQKALTKPVHERRWAMAIDLAKCIGCSACTIACVAENKLPPGVVYRPVIEEEIGEYPHVSRTFMPRPCMQCESPPCVAVCPVDALTVIDADGKQLVPNLP